MVLGDTFWLNAVWMVLPFLIVLAAAIAIVGRLDRGGSDRGSG